MTKVNKNVFGFKKHVLIEAQLRDEIGLGRETNVDYEPLSRSWRPKSSSPVFVENVGAVSIFSIKQLQDNYKNAELVYGDDRKRMAEALLKDAAKNGNRRNLAGAPLLHDIEALRVHFPNFSEAIDHIAFAAALSSLSCQNWFQMSPILLLGPPGIGKTAFAQAFSKILKVSFKRLDVGHMSTAALIAGLSMGWSTGHTGEICRLLTNSDSANPLVLLDEVDKVTGHANSPLEPTLLALLEPESSANFVDEALQVHLNCKHILYMASANDISQMSSPLLSRFTVVYVREPNIDEAPMVIRNIYQSIRRDNPWGSRFEESLDDNVLEHLSNYRPRQISSLLRSAFGRAAIKGNKRVTVEDFPAKETKQQFRIGFL